LIAARPDGSQQNVRRLAIRRIELKPVQQFRSAAIRRSLEPRDENEIKLETFAVVDCQQLDGIFVGCSFSIETREARIERGAIDGTRAVLFKFSKDLKVSARIGEAVRRERRVAAQGKPCALDVRGKGVSPEREHGLFECRPGSLKQLLPSGTEQMSTRNDKFRSRCFTIGIRTLSREVQ
jgi:hypothetical protein